MDEYCKEHEIPQISREKVRLIVQENGLISTYNKNRRYNKPKQNNIVNESEIGNVLNKQFDQKEPLKALVSDTSYFKIKGRFYYVCIIIDLWNREIIGHSCGHKKDAELVLSAIRSIQYSLINTNYFHNDRGLEFDNKKIDTTLKSFGIQRSLSDKGSPGQNAVAESTFNTIKIEFFKGEEFNSFKDFVVKFNKFVYRYNNKRPHRHNNGNTPIYKRYSLKKD